MTSIKALNAHEANLPPNLKKTFDALETFLFGECSPQQLLDNLGTSPSSFERFFFYQKMVHNNPKLAIRGAYKASGYLCDQHDPKLFEKLLDLHFDLQPAHGWAVAEVFRDFHETIARASSQGLKVPTQLAEVVDYEAVRYELFVLSHGEVQPGKVHPSAKVRMYSFDVRKYVKQVYKLDEAGYTDEASVEVQSPVVPSGDALTCILHRDLRTQAVRLREPQMPHLLALALLSGEVELSDITETGVAADEIAKATTQLKAWGVIAP